MASTITRRKTIRIANETDDYFKDKPLNRMVECLQGLLESGRIEWNGEELIVNERAKVPDKLIGELEEIGGYFEMTVEDLIREFVRMVNDGEICVEDKVLYPVMPEWAEKIDERVRKEGIDGEKVAKKVLEMIERGEI